MAIEGFFSELSYIAFAELQVAWLFSCVHTEGSPQFCRWHAKGERAKSSPMLQWLYAEARLSTLCCQASDFAPGRFSASRC